MLSLVGVQSDPRIGAGGSGSSNGYTDSDVHRAHRGAFQERGVGREVVGREEKEVRSLLREM